MHSGRIVQQPSLGGLPPWLDAALGSYSHSLPQLARAESSAERQCLPARRSGAVVVVVVVAAVAAVVVGAAAEELG